MRVRVDFLVPQNNFVITISFSFCYLRKCIFIILVINSFFSIGMYKQEKEEKQKSRFSISLKKLKLKFYQKKIQQINSLHCIQNQRVICI